jgi:hypothetical protein
MTIKAEMMIQAGTRCGRPAPAPNHADPPRPMPEPPRALAHDTAPCSVFSDVPAHDILAIFPDHHKCPLAASNVLAEQTPFARRHSEPVHDTDNASCAETSSVHAESAPGITVISKPKQLSEDLQSATTNAISLHPAPSNYWESSSCSTTGSEQYQCEPCYNDYGIHSQPRKGHFKPNERALDRVIDSRT